MVKDQLTSLQTWEGGGVGSRKLEVWVQEFWFPQKWDGSKYWIDTTLLLHILGICKCAVLLILSSIKLPHTYIKLPHPFTSPTTTYLTILAIISSVNSLENEGQPEAQTVRHNLLMSKCNSVLSWCGRYVLYVWNCGILPTWNDVGTHFNDKPSDLTRSAAKEERRKHQLCSFIEHRSDRYGFVQASCAGQDTINKFMNVTVEPNNSNSYVVALLHNSHVHYLIGFTICSVAIPMCIVLLYIIPMCIVL